METVIRLPDGRYRMFVKGASEIVLTFVSSYDAGEGKVIAISPSEAEQMKDDVITRFGEEGLRVICLAYRDFDASQNWDDEDSLLKDLSISSFVGIQDPVRDEVPDAVATCQRAGVTVRMVTGDNMITAHPYRSDTERRPEL